MARFFSGQDTVSAELNWDTVYTVFSVEHFKSGGDIKCGGCVRLTATREMEPDPG